jgi:hypothetical protein
MSKETNKVKARVLCDNQYGAINTVVELDKAAAEAGVKAGQLDTHPSAIKAAEAIQAEKEKAEKAAAKKKG